MHYSIVSTGVDEGVALQPLCLPQAVAP